MKWFAYGFSPEVDAAWIRFFERWDAMRREDRRAWSRAQIKRLSWLAVEVGLIEGPGTTHPELVSFGRLLSAHAGRNVGGWRMYSAAMYAHAKCWDVERAPSYAPPPRMVDDPDGPWLLEGVERPQNRGRPPRPPRGWVEGWRPAPARGRVPATLLDEGARGARYACVDPSRVAPAGVLLLERHERHNPARKRPAPGEAPGAAGS